jgi:hypothetical protein
VEGAGVDVAILTAVYGGYDVLHPLPDDHGFDKAVCVTDDPFLSADGWTMVVVPSHAAPRLAAKRPKMLPFDFVDADVAVWLDASAQVVDTGFRDWCVAAAEGADLVAWNHPEDRDCLFAEVDYCWSWPKYRKHPLREQAEFYRAAGMPSGFGLWACGTLVWRNTPQANLFGRRWLAENERWSIQDQVSLPYLLWELQPRFSAFPAHEFDNRWIRWHEHLSAL